ncbi:MAG: hypothetical protein FJW36_23790 [Acidobacteria bacterium]|nr:hypothetical protein [Acidobacteriota bacterium]
MACLSGFIVAVTMALDTQQIQLGIDQSASSGKPFVLPAGVHEVGTLRLRARSHLRFAEGAVLRMLPLNVDFAGMEKLRYEPFADLETSRFEHALLFGGEVDGVTIDGPGRIECARTSRGGPKPISLRNCRNVKISGITIDQAPNYAISMIGCQRVEILNVKIARAHADGIDIDGSSDVWVRDVDVESHDDAICLKSSASLNKKLRTTNITIDGAKLRTASVFFKIGTESYGDVANVRVRRLQLEGGLGNRHGNPGIALETVDGGTIRNVEIEDVTMASVGTPLFLRVGARGNAPGKPGPGELSGVRLKRISANGTRYASVIAGLNDAPIRGLTIEDMIVEPVGTQPFYEKQKVAETRTAYPEPIQFGPIPASGFYLRHVVGLSLRQVRYRRPPQVPAVLMDFVGGSFADCKEVEPNRVACGDVFQR